MHPVLQSHIKNNSFHHCYLLVGNPDISKTMAIEASRILLKIDPDVTTHPDFSHQSFDYFGMGESRDLKSRAQVTPLLGDKKVFILEIESFGLESSNALLKLFEEPPQGTHFFIITSSGENIISTLRSRLIVLNSYNNKVELKNETEDLCKKFLSDLPVERFKKIKIFDKDKKGAMDFLNGLEFILAEELLARNATHSVVGGSKSRHDNNKIKKITNSINEIERSKELLLGAASSVKMILEHIALVLIQVL